MNPNKTTPKDFFLHLTATVILYASIISFVNLSFAIINYLFPDALAGYFYTNSVAWPISMLVVLTPVLILVEWLIKRDYAQNPDKITLWVRRWRIDLTLFLTVLVLIGDLVALINTYISGEITARFVYKFLAVLIIFGIVFAFYLLERMQERKQVRKALVWIWVVLVIAAVVGGFMTVGSPYKQRALRLDSQRVSDLQTIQYQIVYYWQQKQKLPGALADLKDPLSGMTIPTDPETKQPYEYKPTVDKSFELCATFGADSQDLSGKGAAYGRGGYYATDVAYPIYGGMDENWKHSAGRTCFSRTIDPDKYPPIKEPRPTPL